MQMQSINKNQVKNLVAVLCQPIICITKALSKQEGPTFVGLLVFSGFLSFFLSASKRQPRASTDCFFHFFPKKIPFSQFSHFYLLTHIYRSFFPLFPKKIPFSQFRHFLHLPNHTHLQIAFSTCSKKNSVQSIQSFPSSNYSHTHISTPSHTLNIATLNKKEFPKNSQRIPKEFSKNFRNNHLTLKM